MKHKNLKNLPLKGIKVLDAASYIAAPLVSALMTDYGAEVIKIESHTGDTYRDAVKGGAWQAISTCHAEEVCAMTPVHVKGGL